MFFCFVFLKRVSPVFKSLVEDHQRNPGFSDAGGRETKVLGGRLLIKDQSHRKVGEAQQGYHRLLGRCS